MISIKKSRHILFVLLLTTPFSGFSQYTEKKGNDVTAPLHLMKPDYDIPYGEVKKADIKITLDRIYDYLSQNTPPQLVDKTSGKAIEINQAGSNSIFKQGDFRLLSYEWGVTYTGMLEVAESTGDKRYKDYALDRIGFIGDVAAFYRNYLKNNPKAVSPVRSVLTPHALDDAGSIAASMIKAMNQGANKATIRPMVDNFLNYVMKKEFRLSDGTLARNRPQPNTLWLDDLYMSVPAIMQMGKLTGDQKYFDEAIKQLKLFSGRMFNEERGLFMHGWVQDMDPHPRFHWARANGWAIMTMTGLTLSEVYLK